MNELLQQAAGALDEARASVRQLDQNLDTAVRQLDQNIQDALAETRAVLQDLPTEELHQTAADLQATVGELRTQASDLTEDTKLTLATVRRTAQVAMVTLGVLGLGGFVWLIRGVWAA